MAYTPLQPGQTPTLGTSGQGVAQLQTQLNTQNAGMPGWTPLEVDGIYGPLTQAGANFKPQSQLIVTGTNPEKEFAQNTQEINNMIQTNSAYNPQQNPNQTQNPNQNYTVGQEEQGLANMMQNYSDPYTQMLDKIASTSDKATQNLIATIKATKSSREANINTEYDRLKQGLFSLGLSSDKMQFTPDLVYGQITQAENARMSKLQELDRQEATALLEAQQASEEQDFKTLREKREYLKSIRKSRLDLLKESYDTMAYETKIGELQAFQIYDELQKMPEANKMPFLQQLASKFNIPVSALTSQVAEITRDRQKKAQGTGGGYTSQELRKLRQAGIDPKNIQEADDFLYGDEEKDDFYTLGDLYADDAENQGDDGFMTPEAFKALLNKAQTDKITRTNVLQRYSDKLNLKNKRKAKLYGLTEAEYNKYK